MNKPPTITIDTPAPRKVWCADSTCPSLRLARQSLEETPTRTLLSTSPCHTSPIRTCPSGPKHTHNLSGLPLRFDDRVAHIITRFLGFFMMVQRTGPTPFLYIWDCESHGHRMTLSVFQGTCEGAQTKRCPGMIRKQEERAARAPTCSQFLRNIPPHAFLRTVQNP